MDVVYCHTCSSEVQGLETRCLSCGSELRGTVADSQKVTKIETRPAPELELQTGSTFAGRFTIIEKIGAGGMGVVYKAKDKSLGTHVALKLIQPGLARLPHQAERFRREVRLTREITHANICRVHDLGETDDVLFLSMQWIEGETLAQLIRQAGSFNDERALQIAERIARALEAAHAKKVIHRDLKPANVMVDLQGNVFVVDFGLAAEQGAEAMTGEGVIAGTPLYMSPEQRKGEPLDSRTDLYSLGLILREMLTGHKLDPFGAPSEEISAEVHPLTAPVIERLLSRDRDGRYPSATAARMALHELRENHSRSTPVVPSRPTTAQRLEGRRVWPWVAAAVPLIAVASYMAIGILSPPAVDTPADEFFARGLHYLREEAQTSDNTNNAIDFFHKSLDVRPGSAIVMAALGEAYWLRYGMEHDRLFRTEAERWVGKARDVDPDLPEVHGAQAVGFLAEGKPIAAKSELERALAKEPDLAWAWANLGSVHGDLGNYAPGLEAFDTALALKPDGFGTHLLLGLFHERFQEYGKAAQAYRRATELKPNSAIAWNDLGAALMNGGRIDEASVPFLRSIEVGDYADPRSNIGTIHYVMGEYEEAARQYRRATALDPKGADHWGNLGDALVALGRKDEAGDAYVAAVERARERAVRWPLDADARIKLGAYCAKTGDEVCALENADAAVELQPNNALLLTIYAEIHCLLDREDDSLNWLDRAVKFGASKSQIEAMPCFASLRLNPRYQTILTLSD